MADLARDVYVDALVLDYIARIVDATRSAEQVRLGVSIRGALALTRATKTRAASQGRTYATPGRRQGARRARALAPADPAPGGGVRRRHAEAVIGQVLLDVPPPSQREAV